MFSTTLYELWDAAMIFSRKPECFVCHQLRHQLRVARPAWRSLV